MNRSGKSFALAVAIGCAGGAFPTMARAAEAGPTAADFARLQAEVTRLQQDVREERQLVLNLMQAEQQRYDVLLQLIRAAGVSGASLPPAPSLPAMPSGGAGASHAAPQATAAEATAPAGGVGTISGKVALPAGARDAYVYIEGLKGGAGPRARTIEITQKDKQFSPQVLAVPVGSKVVFPNADTVFHNVFSSTPGDAFDVGSIKAGQSSRPVVLSKAGHVEIFCNIHRRMRADVLVVPNGYFAKVSGDGSFELGGVPTGNRKVVLWGPGIKSTSQHVEVTAKGAQLRLTAQPEPVPPHLNKLGQVYGSYDD